MNTERTKLPFNAVFASILALWLAYFLLTTLRASVAGFEFQEDMLWRRGVVTMVGIAMTVVFWFILRLFDERPLWARVAAALLIAFPIAIPIAQTNQWIFAEIQKMEEEQFGKERGFKIRRDEAGNLLVDIPGKWGGTVEGEGDDASTVVIAPAPTQQDQWRAVIDIAIGRYFLLLAWAGIYFAMLAGAQARVAERREQEFRSAAKAAELRSLRYQVNPHFLFNTLNSLSALVMTGKADQAEEMIQSISRFYRHSLTDDPTNDVSLEDEFDLQRHYLEIEAVRFPDRLRVEFDLPTDLAEARIPGMILQPLVENSVKYAVAPTNREVTVKLSAREEFGRLVVVVSDDGPGAQDQNGHGFGIGLANVRDRIQARFGREATITSQSDDTGYVTELRVPLVKHAL